MNLKTAIFLMATVGPWIPFDSLDAAQKSPTFSKDIAPILFKHCANCHRVGEVGPFPLLTFEDAHKRAKTLATVVEKRLMPPWKAEDGPVAYHDNPRLSDGQIAIIKNWVAAGTPEGNRADLPATPKFSTGWQLGQPDQILQMSQEFNINSEGRDVYQCFVIPTGSTENQYISAVEVRPGNRSVVHHVIAYTDTTGNGRKRDATTIEPGYRTFGGPGFFGAEWLDGWAPGKNPRHLPPGHGMLVPKGADIILEVHYKKSGKAETDQSQIGLHFCKDKVDKRVRVHSHAHGNLRIPAGEAHHSVTNIYTVPAAVTLLAVWPHMHLIGREMTVTAALPDGKMQPMVRVTDWDFNWQLGYHFKEPLKFPARTKITLKASYDNSENNPANPSRPPKYVRWGEQTTDEMCIAFYAYTIDAERINHAPSKSKPGTGTTGR
ncbi:MAG: ascorbate-dependent monooxygenase [Pedosphaera sp.]|nr:ascorbate-dependent monooxygenase [Pedosphaera sp.]